MSRFQIKYTREALEKYKKLENAAKTVLVNLFVYSLFRLHQLDRRALIKFADFQ